MSSQFEKWGNVPYMPVVPAPLRVSVEGALGINIVSLRSVTTESVALGGSAACEQSH